MESPGSIPLSRFSPCGVNSNNQANAIQNGNPMTAAIRNQRVAPSGNPTAGLNCDRPCPNAHTVPA